MFDFSFQTIQFLENNSQIIFSHLTKILEQKRWMKSVRTWTRIEVLITNGKSANFFYSDKLHQIRSSCVAPQQRRRDDVTLFEFHAFYTQSSVVLFFLLHFDHEKRIAELLYFFSSDWCFLILMICRSAFASSHQHDLWQTGSWLHTAANH